MNALVASGLGKRYGSNWALSGCTLEIPSGSVTALVGPNGAGKTTLLHLAVGLTRPSAGTVSVLGHSPIDDAADVLPRVGFVAQDHPLYKSLTIAETLRLGRAMNASWDDAFALARIEHLGLPLSKKVAQLSGGQQAQIALTLALAKKPELLLLDEPVASLDPLARREFMQSVMEVVAEREMTVVLSSHIIADLERVCDHIVILAQGRTQLVGSIDDIVAKHRLLTGPRTDASELARVHDVIRESHTERQTTLLVHSNGHVYDSCWQLHEVDLEEIVLAYLGQREEVRGMTWAAWRLQRTETIVAAAIVAAVAVLLVPVGLHMASVYSQDHLSACANVQQTLGSCGPTVGNFLQRFEGLNGIIGWFNLLPGIVGVLLAAPLLLELENGTFRFAWTQSVTRRRWITGKLGIAVAVGTLAALAFSQVLTWYSGPLVHLNGRLQSSTFDFEGTVDYAYVLFALGLALTIGVLVRRAVPALIVAFVSYVVARVFTDSWLRQRLLTPHSATWKSNALGPNLNRAWVLQQGPSDRFGHFLFSNNFSVAASPSHCHGNIIGGHTCIACVQRADVCLHACRLPAGEPLLGTPGNRDGDVRRDRGRADPVRGVVDPRARGLKGDYFGFGQQSQLEFDAQQMYPLSTVEQGQHCATTSQQSSPHGFAPGHFGDGLRGACPPGYVARLPHSEPRHASTARCQSSSALLTQLKKSFAPR